MDKYLEKLNTICGYSKELSNLITEVEGEDSTPCLEIAERLSSEPFRVLVIGEFSRGKSTFINALLGQKVLPVSVRPTTAVICVLKNSSEKKAKIVYRDKREEPTVVKLETAEEIKALDAIVTAKNENANHIEVVEIDYPLPGISLPFELVDTPGVNDIDTQREEITYGYLSKADAAIFLLDLQQPLSASEKRFLEEKVLGNDVNKILFVVNKIDQLKRPEDLEKALAHIKRNLEALKSESKFQHIIPVSAKLALKGRSEQSQDAIDLSQFVSFERDLLKFLEMSSGVGRLSVAAARIERIAQLLAKHLDELDSALSGEQEKLELGLAELEKKVRRLQQEKSFLEADIKMAVKTYEHNATSSAKREIHNLKISARSICSQDAFPSDDLISSLRSAINIGMRNALNCVEAATEGGLLELKKKYGEDYALAMSSESKFLGWSGVNMGTDSRKIQDDGNRVSMITAFVGSAIFGLGFLVAVPLGIFGGWLATVFANQKEADRIRQQVESAISEIESKVDLAVTNSLNEFTGLLEDKFLKPRLEALKQHEITHRDLMKATSMEMEDRRNLAEVINRHKQKLGGILIRISETMKS